MAPIVSGATRLRLEPALPAIRLPADQTARESSLAGEIVRQPPGLRLVLRTVRRLRLCATRERLHTKFGMQPVRPQAERKRPNVAGPVNARRLFMTDVSTRSFWANR